MTDDGRRRGQFAGLVELALTRLWKQATRTTSGRLVATVAGVALTIALLLLVTGIALGLAGGGIAAADDADVRIGPAEETVVASVDGVEGVRLGEANEHAAEIRSEPDIEHASPVLVEPVRLEPADGGESRIVLLVGVVPNNEPRTIAGLSTARLEPGDPHYGDGTFDGPRAEEIVLSEAAAERFESDPERLVRASDRSDEDIGFDIAAVEATEEGHPVALVHLSELQSLAGTERDGLADRLLVWGDADAATAAGEDRYPDTTIQQTATATNPAAMFDDDLAFATSLIALVVGIGICASFITTTMGMTVEEDRRVLAVLEAIGFPAYSRLAVVGISTLATTLVGAILGIGLGWLAILTVNRLVESTVAVAHPLFVPYAVGVALVSGLLAVPYPLVVAARTTVLDEVGR
ncbi:ABC transporter permease [Natranaeroarchaeum sulfidigenes]|uniref:ABC-type antimicrobial peptide transport system, permease component n=1 Tax=Natranaeroarchaeum sulfidigenes TaxID=2784880 RepID=A0A897MLK1_9EURY|nr:ABC transporter permease [Natranaeroarchaeum sulfidigenes]QSG01497.1 ABC-type antimicrobial peptide transport system, permease component [Natranaeroarchaeum sulfidigenes]